VAAVVLRGDAAHLPLPDGSVDLICTSPPYWGMRTYTDGGAVYDGQIGSEATPGEYLEALWRCTREWMRVLKPEGSIFVDLGDKYSLPGKGERNMQGTTGGVVHKVGAAQANRSARDFSYGGTPAKSLLFLPERYRIGCVDRLGLIGREVIEWHKPNPLPDSTRDRCGRSHEDICHLVKQSRYFAAVDEIREPHSENTNPGWSRKVGNQSGNGVRHRTFAGDTTAFNRLGKVPGSVWEIASQPLIVPPHLDVDHFAAFPMELPRRLILGWSPSGICLQCGEGRCPVVTVANIEDRKGRKQRIVDFALDAAHGPDGRGGERWKQSVSIAGYACACTPYTDHPERRGKDFHNQDVRDERGMNGGDGGERFRRYMEELANPRGPVREYHLEAWFAPPTRPAVVVDPFGGTGTSTLVADVLGRTGITVDRSLDYCRLARWRTRDPAERARALGVPKPPPVPEGQASLFDGLEAS
jgi:SAM-dependent methyltransferase